MLATISGASGACQSGVVDLTADTRGVVWNAKAKSFLVEMKSSTTMTHGEMARALNQPECGYRADNSRPYSVEHIHRELRKLFPPSQDVQQVLWHLRDLKSRPGWETLEYKPEFIRVAGGLTIKSLHVTLPHAAELVDKFGHVVHCDCTFGVLITGHKVWGAGGNVGVLARGECVGGNKFGVSCSDHHNIDDGALCGRRRR